VRAPVALDREAAARRGTGTRGRPVDVGFERCRDTARARRFNPEPRSAGNETTADTHCPEAPPKWLSVGHRYGADQVELHPEAGHTVFRRPTENRTRKKYIVKLEISFDCSCATTPQMIRARIVLIVILLLAWVLGGLPAFHALTNLP